MSELRKDYILDKFVIIAAKRGKRPHDFKAEKERKKSGICYFCPGNEHTTPPEKYRLSDGESWKIRVFDNKFPAVEFEGEYALRTDNGYYTFANAYGVHEVIVDTPNHDEELADLSVEDLTNVLYVYRLRLKELALLPGIKYVSLFKNKGLQAGCSIAHSHTQIIAYNIVPSIIIEKEKASENNCPYCEIIEKEKDSSRSIFVDEHIAAFTPYASRFPFEVLIIPRRHVLELKELTDKEMESMAKILKQVLLKLKELNAPYNFYFHYGIKSMHLQLSIIPRLTNWAGFEHATGTIINPVPPEDAAKFYKS